MTYEITLIDQLYGTLRTVFIKSSNFMGAIDKVALVMVDGEEIHAVVRRPYIKIYD